MPSIGRNAQLLSGVGDIFGVCLGALYGVIFCGGLIFTRHYVFWEMSRSFVRGNFLVGYRNFLQGNYSGGMSGGGCLGCVCRITCSSDDLVHPG